MKSVPDLCRRRAGLTPAAIAFEKVASGRQISFAALDAEVDRAVAAFASLGIAEGDRVAVLCHNDPVFFALLFAAARSRIILVPLNWRLTPAELGPVLAHCDPRLLLHDQATADLARGVGGTCAVMHLDAFRACGAEAPPQRPVADAWDTDRPWYLLYTSGTTGRPKAVIQTVGMALANAVNVQQATGLGPADTTLNMLPLFHTAGINLHALPLFLAGGCSLVIPRFDADAVMALLTSGRISLVFGVPAVYQALSLHPSFATADVSAVRHWGCGGAPLAEPLMRAFLARGAAICNGMGMTETGPTVFLMDPAEAAAKIGSVGRPQLLAEVRIVDFVGEDVAPGGTGELLFRGPGVTPGYYNDPAATAEAFAPGGWLRSGDVGRRDADGCYYIVDRIKDMFISGGENVVPAEVEAAIQSHPAVLEVAVLGVPDDRWGEVGHAVVVLRPGAEADGEAIRSHARFRLAGYKVPRHVTIVADFPRTAAGKVQKHVLRRSLGTAAAR